MVLEEARRERGSQEQTIKRVGELSRNKSAYLSRRGQRNNQPGESQPGSDVPQGTSNSPSAPSGQTRNGQMLALRAEPAGGQGRFWLFQKLGARTSRPLCQSAVITLQAARVHATGCLCQALVGVTEPQPCPRRGAPAAGAGGRVRGVKGCRLTFSITGFSSSLSMGMLVL